MTDHIESNDSHTTIPPVADEVASVDHADDNADETTRQGPITPAALAAERKLRRIVATPAYDDILSKLRRSVFPWTSRAITPLLDLRVSAPPLLDLRVLTPPLLDLRVTTPLLEIPKFWTPPQIGNPPLWETIAGVQTDVFEAMKLESLLPKIGFANHRQVAAVADSLTTALRHPFTIPDMSGRITGFETQAWMRSSIVSLLHNWQTLARFGHRKASRGLRALPVARNAVLRGDLEAVKQFAKEWLGFARVPRMMLEAVMDALLECDGDIPFMTEKELIKHLRGRSEAKHNLWRPIPETQIGGRPVRCFDEKVSTDGSSLIELTAAPDTTLRETYTDPRLRKILNDFSDTEISVIEMHADSKIQAKGDRKLSWSSAAIECGQPASLGESIRRRLIYRRNQMLAQTG